MTKEVEPIRVMIVDGSAVIRGRFTRVLESSSDIRVVASVGDGAQALKVLEREEVDLVLLDIEMPNMDGLTALPNMIQAKPGLIVIMASSLTERNANISLRVLRMGATDYVTKPHSRLALRDAENFKRNLVSKVRALGRPMADRSAGRALLPTGGRSGAPVPGAAVTLRPAGAAKPEMITIGNFTGGPQALNELLRTLTKSVNLPILFTQHMPPTFMSILATHIEQAAGWPCAESFQKSKNLLCAWRSPHADRNEGYPEGSPAFRRIIAGLL